MFKINPLKSKTFWGAALLAAAYVVQHGVSPETLATAAGGILATVGMRDGIAKLSND